MPRIPGLSASMGGKLVLSLLAMFQLPLVVLVQWLSGMEIYPAWIAFIVSVVGWALFTFGPLNPFHGAEFSLSVMASGAVLGITSFVILVWPAQSSFALSFPQMAGLFSLAMLGGLGVLLAMFHGPVG